ncbi:hypothetical protein TNCV_1777621 [Trichonephila clavipes]|nr:hypothetical protein TNCV_1777621 [Trichonephila clavipes]
MIIPSRSLGLDCRQTATLLVKLVGGEERWEVPDHLQGVLPQNWGGTELNRSVTSVLSAYHVVISSVEFELELLQPCSKNEDPVTRRQKGLETIAILSQDNFAIAYTDGSSDIPRQWGCRNPPPKW